MTPPNAPTIPPFPVIVGPTAGGKSALAIALAQRLRTADQPPPILTMDSMQAFRRMDIGTAKPTPDERRAIPHKLIDLAEPAEPFSVDRWLREAERELENARANNLTPIVAGGTHLYAKALLDGLFEGPPADPQLRQQLNDTPLEQLRDELQRTDPDTAERIHPNDRRRTVRAIEVHRTTGIPISQHQKQWDTTTRPDALLVCLMWNTDTLNRRINQRVRDMMAAGLLDEVTQLRDQSAFGPQSAQALGYKQLLQHLDGTLSLNDATEKIKIETRRFAKNQRTWLRRLAATPNALVLNAEDATPDQLADHIAAALHEHNANRA